MSIELFFGDCFDVFPTLASGSIDMVCADIPYGTTQCSWDTPLDLPRMWLELYRVTKPSAAIVLFSAQPFTSVLVNSNLRDWRTEWIWEKGNATGFFNVAIQPLRAHENVQVFYRRQPTYNPQITHGHTRKKSKRKTVNSNVYGKALSLTEYDSTSRYPRDVQFFSSDKQKRKYHDTQKPLDLVRYLIETYSNPGDLVLDFTMGSGTAGVACQLTGRNFIGIDSDPRSYSTACGRNGVDEGRCAA
ncbi:site-specific DNA-methyltransferase [Phytobacter diazotrophicus]|uniref:DNA-methyltransferase n=1 Tax=Phytobacter diazotrophicus TaxID=395631 RepID=UPI00232C26B4|nr:site-specific DNA-methyltransferase [Phytobacter diazotrophicus]MDC0728580.1 site-specific DNA-methyltransferase [Phytobacter diazotrophicus]MDC0735777.1 site-specific DNA-methyltransferase [Phytobacter diazotrophicus]